MIALAEGQHVRIEIALLHARRVDQHDPVEADRGHRREDAAERLGPGERQEQIDSRARRRRFRQRGVEDELAVIQPKHLRDSRRAAEGAPPAGA